MCQKNESRSPILAGVVRYGSVGAKGLGGLPLIDESWALAWEVGAHIGYKFDVDHGKAPTPQLAIQFGIDYERWNGPKFNQSTLPGASARAVQNITFDFGVWLGF